MALGRSSRNGRRPKWVALHSAEGARRRQDLYAFFDRNQNSSSHVGIDGGGWDDWIDSSWAAWTLLNGNPISINAEMCAFARWTRAQWLSTGVVDGVVNPRAMVRAAALWAKRECERWGIPKRYIGAAGVARGDAGIIIHWDYSRGTGDGDHHDTGEFFPLDVFFADMQEVEDDMYNDGDRERDEHLAWRLKTMFDVLGHTPADQNAPDEHCQFGMDMNGTRWRIQDFLHLNETIGGDAFAGEQLPFVTKFKQLIATSEQHTLTLERLVDAVARIEAKLDGLEGGA